jgi:hypothetical protein
MERMQPVTCLPRKPFFRSLTHAELNIHTISSVSILNRLSAGVIPWPGGPPPQTYTFKPEWFVPLSVQSV